MDEMIANSIGFSMSNKYSFIVAVIFFIGGYSHLSHASISDPGIAVVHSYHENFGWVQEVNEGIASYMAGKSLFGMISKFRTSPQLTYYFLDAKNHQNDFDYLTREGREIADSVKRKNFTHVLVVDDEALEFVGKHFVGDQKIKVVFLGVNNDPRKYGVISNLQKPDKNFTGLISEQPFQYSISLMKQLTPEIKSVVVFFDDSVSGRAIYDNFLRHARLYHPDFEKKVIKTVISNDWEQWQSTILKHQASGRVFLFGTFYSLRNSTTDKVMPTAEVVDWIVKHSNVPEFTILSNHVDEGFLLTIANPGFIHGYEACDLLAKMMDGKSPESFPVGTPQQKSVLINMKRAEQLGIRVPVELITLSAYYRKLSL